MLSEEEQEKNVIVRTFFPSERNDVMPTCLSTFSTLIHTERENGRQCRLFEKGERSVHFPIDAHLFCVESTDNKLVLHIPMNILYRRRIC